MFSLNSLKRRSHKAAKPARSRPALEALEDRLTPSVVFTAHDDGTWAYNTGNNAWRRIRMAKPIDISEGSDGVMFASYDTGTYRYDYRANNWTKLRAEGASHLDASDDNTLYATLSGGTYRYVTGWQRLTTDRAAKLAAVDIDTFFGSYGNGTWRYDRGSWLKLTAKTTDVMKAASNGDLIAGYADGTYVWSGGWNRIRASGATAIAGEYLPGGHFRASKTFIVASFGSGTFRYDFSTRSWTKVSPSSATALAMEQQDGGADDDAVYGAYGSGTWVLRAYWNRISTSPAVIIAG